MRLAAKRLFVLAVLALAGVLSSAAVAGPLDPIGTVTSAVSTIAGQTTIVSDLTGGGGGGGGGSGSGSGSPGSGGSGSGATDPVSGVVGTVTGTAGGLLSGGSGSGGTGGGGSAGGGGSSGGAGGVLGSVGGALGSGGAVLGGGGAAGRSGTGAVDGLTGVKSGGGSSGGGRASRTRAHTRFDRLPRRYENLLKRVELGHNVRANIARLRTLLANASPQFRARILHLIRQEIRRLRKGGLTRRERLAVRRLHRLIAALHTHATPAPAQKPTTVASFGRPGTDSAAVGGVLGTGASQTRTGNNSHKAGAARPVTQDNGGVPFMPRPVSPSTALYWLALILLGIVFCALLLLAVSSQRPLPIPLPGVAAARAPQLRAIGLMMAFVGGLGIYLLVLLA